MIIMHKDVKFALKYHDCMSLIDADHCLNAVNRELESIDDMLTHTFDDFYYRAFAKDKRILRYIRIKLLDILHVQNH